ncbi:hypothetical protein ACA910_022225 [Epithemia clementina (nom. ined.)]
MDENSRQQSEEEIDFHPPSWDNPPYATGHKQYSSFGAWGDAQQPSRFAGTEQQQREEDEDEDDNKKPAARLARGVDTEGNEPGSSARPDLGSSDSFESSHGRLPPRQLKITPVASAYHAPSEFDAHETFEGDDLMPNFAMGAPCTPFQYLQEAQPSPAPAASLTGIGAEHVHDLSSSVSHMHLMEVGRDDMQHDEIKMNDHVQRANKPKKTNPKKKRSTSKHQAPRTASRQPERRSTRARSTPQAHNPSYAEESDGEFEPARSRSNRAGPGQHPEPSRLVAQQRTGTTTRTGGRDLSALTQPREFFTPSEAEIASCSCNRKLSALKTFYQRLNELAEYRELFNSCDVPQKFAHNKQLGVWVNKVRMERKKHDSQASTSINDIRIRHLDSLGFNWGEHKGDRKWEEHFRALEEYKEEHGDCRVPTKYPRNTALGRWVSTQRSERKLFLQSKPSLIDQEKIDRLDGLGFVWDAMNPES